MAETEQKSIKGIKMQTLSYVMIVVAVISFAVVIIETFRMQIQYNELTSATESYMNCEKYAAQFSAGSNYLCDKVRLYVINGDKEYSDDYFREIDVTKRREAALEGVVSFVSDTAAVEQMNHAKEKDDRLMDREVYAMRLAAEARHADISALDMRISEIKLSDADLVLSDEEKLLEAQNVVFGTVYQEERKSIESYIDKFIDRQVSLIDQQMHQSSESLKASLRMQLVFIIFLFLMDIVIFVLIMRLIIRPLKIYMHCIEDGKMLDITGAYEFKYLAITYNNIYEINSANEQMLKHKAEHDSLTGLVNRGAFDQFTALCTDNGTNIAVLIIDADKFKNINDSHGHSVGDAVLQRISKLLKVHFRVSDCIARIGGDEFSVVMMDVTPDSKNNIMRKITSINALLTEPDDGLPPIFISAGVAFSDNGFSKKIYSQADSALYYAKEHGRKGCAFYDESMPIMSEQ